MKEKENILYIRQRFEPSSELKRRVMERAEKLEAGRKTFGNEETTADNKQINEEQIQMNAISTKEIVKVKKRFPIVSISAAACAAAVIGIAMFNMNEKLPKPLPTTENQGTTTDAQTVTTDDETVIKDEDSTPENVMIVTQKDGSTYTITDEERIAAIDALVEKAKTCHVWDGEEVPTLRTIEYTVDGKKRIVEISEGQIRSYHPDSEPHPEICRVITVDGRSYALCEFTPDEPLNELYNMTGKGGDLTLQKWNEKNNDNDNEAEVEDNSIYEEYHNEEEARELRKIINDVRENSTPQFEAEHLYYYDEEHLPSWDKVRAFCSFDLDGNYYEVQLYWDLDLICFDVFDWHDGKTRTLLYKDTQNWIAKFDEVFDYLENETEVSDTKEENTEANDSQKEAVEATVTQKETPEVIEPNKEEPEKAESKKEDSQAPETQKEELSNEEVELPELFDLTEEQAVEALKEAGLNCIIGYTFGSEKGKVCSYYSPDPFSDFVRKGTYIAVDISLGEYDGPIEPIKPEHATGYYPSKESKLEVPVPDGLSGSYTFNIYFSDDPEYTNTVDDISGVKSVTFDMCEPDKIRRVIYAKNNSSAEEKLIRYATYEFDYEAETWTLIGELNTDELLASMN